MNKLITCLLTGMIFFLMVSCASIGDRFRITVKNSGESSVTDAMVTGDIFRHKNSELPVGIAASTSISPESNVVVPQVLTVVWKTIDGEKHKSIIKLNIPNSRTVKNCYGVPHKSQWWHIVVAYINDSVVSGWVLFDDRFRNVFDGTHESIMHVFGKQVLYGGDSSILVNSLLITPEQAIEIPRYKEGISRDYVICNNN